MISAQPKDYFAGVELRESQLVRFLYRPQLKQLDLVLNYAAETLDAYSSHVLTGATPKSFHVSAIDFRHLRFLGVDDVSIRFGPNVTPAKFAVPRTEEDWLEHERRLLSPRGRLITAFQYIVRSGCSECRGYFDSCGEHVWQFRKMFVDQRRVRVVRQRGSQILYLDEATNEKMDPQEPFVLE
jgi:hypothetical protein